MRSNREATCHLLAADFPRHSRYTEKCWTQSGGLCGARGRSTLIGESGKCCEAPDSPCNFILASIAHFGRKVFEERLIWQLASPKWDFDDATFERSAAAFDNPDHVSVVIHNYRWRLGLAAGEPQYDELEQRLAQAPDIAVPTITLEGDANGAPHPEASAYAGKFSGRYAHRVITGGVGHNLPQEAPLDFAQAIIDVDASSSA
jgi:pimeloyl-ACP methyl ester carboxylesterase